MEQTVFADVFHVRTPILIRDFALHDPFAMFFFHREAFSFAATAISEALVSRLRM
jgi:hypothetical protein